MWGIDSGIRHAVTGADYGAVRVGAFMGYRILAELAGLRVTPGERTGHVRVEDPAGTATSPTSAATPSPVGAGIPEEFAGEAFLARYGGTTDR